ncbi:MAG: heavy-metal-associated domain-containing protein [Flavonifractor plautii]
MNVTGITCSACSCEKAVSRLDGVQKAEVSLMTNSMTVQYDEDVLSPAAYRRRHPRGLWGLPA